MKVVISKDYSFEISREGWLWLLDHGFDPYEEFPSVHFPSEFQFDNSYYTDSEQYHCYLRDVVTFYDIWKDYPNNPYTTFDNYLKYGGCRYFVNITRHHPLLVQMVEELGDKSYPYEDCTSMGRHKGLKIVEVPDDLKYVIEEPEGGTEYIREISRTYS